MSALVRTFSVRALSAHVISVAKSPVIVGVDGRHLADHHVAGRAVDREEVAGLDGLAGDRDLAGLLVDLDRLAADDAGLAPAAGDDRRVARLAAGAGQDALRQVHAGDVLGAGLLADQQDRVVRVLRGVRDGGLGREDAPCPHAAPGLAAMPWATDFGLRLRVELRQEQVVEAVRAARA